MMSMCIVQLHEQIAVTNALLPLDVWVFGLHFSATDVKQRDVAFAVKWLGNFVFISKLFAHFKFNRYLCGNHNSK